MSILALTKPLVMPVDAPPSTLIQSNRRAMFEKHFIFAQKITHLGLTNANK
jgi:hypothetical protein